MGFTVTKLQSKAPPQAIKRVAAYARVSTGKDAMLNSLSAQISYYSELIQKHPGWIYAGVFVDEALTGTKKNRAGFQELIEKCRAREVDLILTKAISRFARNTVTLLETVRELKALGVDVFFEKENLHSISEDGELLLTILASYSQEESLSVSENCKWRIRKGFESGVPWAIAAFGYKVDKGKFEIIPAEAEVVHLIFRFYLEGMGRTATANMLNQQGAGNRSGLPWRPNLVDAVLRNEKYAGDLLLQKYYTSDHIDKKTRVNHGELPMAYVRNNHPPVIDRQTFDCVQEEIMRRADRFWTERTSTQPYPFTGLIVCGHCGANFRRKAAHGKGSWICGTYARLGKSICHAKQIPEDILRNVSAEVLDLAEFDDALFRDQVKEIRVPSAYNLIYVLFDGRMIERTWAHRPRSESWDEAKREQAREHKRKYWQGRVEREPDEHNG